MADITQDSRFADYLKHIGLSEDQYNNLQPDEKAKHEDGIEDFKVKFPPEYGKEDALAMADDTKKLDDLSPNELVALNNSLARDASTDKDVNQAFAKVQNKIAEKVKNYANGDIEIRIDDVASMQVMIDLQMDGKDKTIAETKAKAHNRLQQFADDYDKDNGLYGVTKEDIERIDNNMETLESLGAEALFELGAYQRQEVPAMDMAKAKEIIANKSYHNLSMADLASLRAIMSSSPGEFDDKAHEAVIGVARDKVLRIAGGKDELKNKEDAASFNKLLNDVSYEYTKNPKLIDVKKLQKADGVFQKFEQELKDKKTTKDPEMQEIYDLLSSIEVTGDLKFVNREKLEQKDENGNFLPDSEIGLLLADVKEETKRKLLSSKEALDSKKFREEFRNNLEFALTEIYMAENLAKGNKNEKDWSKNVENLHKAFENKGKLTIHQSSFIGSEAKKDDDVKTFIRRLEGKTGRTKAVETMTKNNNELNAKKADKHGEKYKDAKQALRTFGKAMWNAGKWGVAFGVASTYGRPAVMAVAAVSVGSQIVGMRREYLQQKKDMAKQGKKLKFKQYLGSNKMKLARLGITTAAIFVPELQTANMLLGAGIGGATAGKSILNAIKNPTKENIWGAVGVTSGVVGGFFAGRAIGAVAADAIQNPGETIGDTIRSSGDAVRNSVNSLGDTIRNTADSVQDFIRGENGNSDTPVVETPKQSEFLDQNKNGISDYIENPESLAADLAEQRIPDSAEFDRNGDGVLDIQQDPNKVQQDVDEYANRVIEERQAAELVQAAEAQNLEKAGLTQAQFDRAESYLLDKGNFNHDTLNSLGLDTDNLKSPESLEWIEKNLKFAEGENGTTRVWPNSEGVLAEQLESEQRHGHTSAPARETTENNEPSPLEVQPLAVPETNVDALAAQVQEQMMDQRVHTIVDSNGQTVQYTTDKDGLHLVNNDKIVGHENLNQDIAKDVAARAAAGNASQNDILAMQNRASPELLAQMQNDYDAHKMPNEVLLAENNKPLSMSGTHTAAINGSSLNYTVDSESGTVRVVGDVSIDKNIASQMTPAAHVDENGQYVSGDSKGNDAATAERIERMSNERALKDIFRNEAAAQDMMARSETQQLNKTELDFLKRHEQTLSSSGFSRGDHGLEYHKENNSQLAQNTLKVDTGKHNPVIPKGGRA